jgi:hypothetical protein
VKIYKERVETMGLFAFGKGLFRSKEGEMPMKETKKEKVVLPPVLVRPQKHIMCYVMGSFNEIREVDGQMIN